jgi:hypothetical protein
MPPFVITVLKTAYRGERELDSLELGKPDVQRAIATGLGPLLFRAIVARSNACEPSLAMRLKAADLTARVETGEKIDAMCEIIDACGGVSPPLVLLKGISTCTQYYPEPHLRSMADIDFLVEEPFIDQVERVLQELGYSRPYTGDAEFYRMHHHTAPFYHSRRHVWVEVHRGLLSQRNRLAQMEVFSAENLAQELEYSEFRGRTVRRLNAELQITYTSAHWAQQLQGTSGLMAMLDIIYILKYADDKLDWSKLSRWLHLDSAAFHVSLLLQYLAHHQVVDSNTAEKLAPITRACTGNWRNLLFWLTDRYIAEGRSFNAILSLRNISVVWKILVSAASLQQALLSIPLRLILPGRICPRL